MARSSFDPRVTGLLDAARGPLHPVAAETLRAALATGWADPTRLHPPGREARALLDTAREVLADALAVRPDELSVHPSAEA
ncbi:MAG TPA: aminotransferase, partial [Ornithinibacter sp.]|nr:aminotransferase [Ornithinibacter sp.]